VFVPNRHKQLLKFVQKVSNFILNHNIKFLGYLSGSFIKKPTRYMFMLRIPLGRRKWWK